MIIWAVREGMGLRPWGTESASLLGKVPFNKPLQVEVKQPRNSKHSALYWVLCHRIADAIGCEADDISHILKVRTGHVRHVKTKRGVEEVPQSISFAKMDQQAFRAFWDKCLVVIETEIGIARPDILEAVKDILEDTE